jgi:tRNA modification GTPase
MQDLDTIFALSSGSGTAGVAVVRVSGPKAFDALKMLSDQSLPAPRVAALRLLRDPKDGSRLDQALVLLFKGPQSFTGEDIVEFHLHGGRAVIESVVDALAAIEGLRFAEPGEFSRRAFENGKMDLTEAEGLNDLIHAQTRAQRTQALRQMDGNLRALYEGWRGDLLGFLGHLEADIDFPDEDLPEGVAERVKPKISIFRRQISDYLDDNRQGQAIRDGFRVVILGEPNAGKSTLLNALSKSDAAIVSEEAGTTRDTIEVQLDLAGYQVRLIDTAGVRDAEGKIEEEGIKRAVNKALDADLKLILIDAKNWPSLDERLKALIDENSILIVTQIDKLDEPRMFHVEQLGLAKLVSESIYSVLSVSISQNIGLAGIFDQITKFVIDRMETRDLPALTRVRHRRALETCVGHLERFEENAGFDPVLAAEDVRMAVRALGEITGRVDVEDMLDIVFSDFCIGK